MIIIETKLYKFSEEDSKIFFNLSKYKRDEIISSLIDFYFMARRDNDYIKVSFSLLSMKLCEKICSSIFKSIHESAQMDIENLGMTKQKLL